MQRSAFARHAILVACMVALTATTVATPARANHTFAATFEIVMIVPDGLGYPVTTLVTPTPTLLPNGSPIDTMAHLIGAESECSVLPGSFGAVPACHFVFDHTRSVYLGTIICVDAAASILKPGVSPAHAGTCTISTIFVPGLANTVSGHCGLASGNAMVLYSDALGQDYIIDLHFSDIGGNLILGGHWFIPGTTQHGLVFGTTSIDFPDISIGPTGNCFNKRQERFLWLGTLTGVTDPGL